MKEKEYETCDLMHNGVCVSTPCICKGMHTQAKKIAKLVAEDVREILEKKTKEVQEARTVKELEEVIRPMIRNDIISLLASEEDLLIYEHYFCTGMEYAIAKRDAEVAELKEQLEWKDVQIKNLLADRKNKAPF